MKWLHFGTIDFEQGQGGVEMHVRCVVRELRKLGVDAQISSDPARLRETWDVVQTHGSMVPGSGRVLSPDHSATHLHTLHGVTWDRMRACREWFWLGGYAAWLREIRAVRVADGVLSIHDQLSLFRNARAAGKPTRVCGNGWDAATGGVAEQSAIPPTASAHPPAALFIGRGHDFVKGADRLVDVLTHEPSLRERFRWFAVPGEGFEGCEWIRPTGPLTADQVAARLAQAAALVIPSRYEGLPLVALEALAHGTRVVASYVGGLRTLPSALDGFVRVRGSDAAALSRALLDLPMDTHPEDRTFRATVNRALLPRWSDVAQAAYTLANEIRGSR